MDKGVAKSDMTLTRPQTMEEYRKTSFHLQEKELLDELNELLQSKIKNLRF